MSNYLLIPQLPSQLQSSPAAANRWLLTARTQYGTLGSLFGALGLFDLLHNPAFRLLLAALLYLLAMQENYSPCQMIPLVPITFPAIIDKKDTIYTPTAPGRNVFAGKMFSLKGGLAKSHNCVSC